MLTDSSVYRSPSQKGRAHDHKLLTVIRRISATCLTGALRLKVRWIPRERNPSDEPSRRWQPRRPRNTGSQTSQHLSCGPADEQSTVGMQVGATMKHNETLIRNEKRVQTGKARAAKVLSAPVAEWDPGQSLLQAASVSTTVGADYLAWVSRTSAPSSLEQIDTALAAFFHDRYWDGFSAQDGEKMIAALCSCTSASPVFKSDLVRLEETLSPLIGRAPLPSVLLMGMAAFCIRRSDRLKGGALLLTFPAYLMPSELRRLSVVISSLERERSTKTGRFRRLSGFGCTRAPDAGALA